MEKYEPLVCEITVFETEDVIRTSSETDTGKEGDTGGQELP